MSESSSKIKPSLTSSSGNTSNDQPLIEENFGNQDYPIQIWLVPGIKVVIVSLSALFLLYWLLQFGSDLMMLSQELLLKQHQDVRWKKHSFSFIDLFPKTLKDIEA